jgi:hypothetical protein
MEKMDTNIIREMLPEYIRGKLSPEQQEIVRRALESDPKLASECRGLEKYFKTLGSLPELKAPVGFAHKVMRRIDEKQEKKSFASVLFRPFHIKLPIETAGVLVTAVLLIILYHPFERMKEPAVNERTQETNAPPPAAEELKKGSARESAVTTDESEKKETGEVFRKKEFRYKPEKSRGPASFTEKTSQDEISTEPKQPSFAEAPSEKPKATGQAASGGSQAKEPEVQAARPAARASGASSAAQAQFAPTPASAPAENAGMRIKDEEVFEQSEKKTAMKSRSRAAAEEIMAEPIQLALSITIPKRDEAAPEKLKKSLPEAADAEVMVEKDKKGHGEPDKIEKAIHSCGAGITKIEMDKPEKGKIRYEIEIQASSYDGLASALSKYGRLEVKSEKPTGMQGGRVKIILVVEGL